MCLWPNPPGNLGDDDAERMTKALALSDGGYLANIHSE